MKASHANCPLDPLCDEVACQLVTELVRIPSLSREEEAAATWLVAQMQRLGFSASRDDAGNAVGVRECLNDLGEIAETVILLGHIDTVPGEIPVRVEQGILHGRGSVDAKGSLATFVIAGSRARLRPGRRLVVVGAVEEESTTSKGARLIAQQYQPDWCIIGEPSGADAVTLGYKGRLQIECRLKQPTAHSAGPQIAIAEHAVNWWIRLQTWSDTFNCGRDKVFEQLQISLSAFNTQSNGITESASLRIGLRLPAEFPVEDFQTFVSEQLAQVTRLPASNVSAQSSDLMETELSFYGYEVAHQEPRTSKLVGRFNRAFRSAGMTPRHKLKTGTSDMNVVSPIWQCPIVAYGPGDSSLDHTPQEQLSLKEYLASIRFLTTILEQSN